MLKYLKNIKYPKFLGVLGFYFGYRYGKFWVFGFGFGFIPKI